MEMISNATEGDFIKENVMKVGKHYIIEDAIIIEKAKKIIKSDTINSYWRNCPDIGHDFIDLRETQLRKS